MARTASLCVLIPIVWVLALALPAAAAPAPAPVEPPAPQPTAAVQQRLDAANQAARANDFAAALTDAEQALTIARGASDRIGEARAHRGRALDLARLGRAAEAVAAWREAAAAWARAGDGPGQIEALAAAAELLEGSQPQEAAALTSQALSLGRAEAKRPVAAAQALNAAGTFSYGRRRLAPARDWFEAAFALAEKHGPESSVLADSLNNLGVVADDQGDLAAAKDYGERALAIRERLADLHPSAHYWLLEASSLNNLGDLAGERGDLALAETYLRRALTFRQRFAPNSLDVAATLNNLGLAAEGQGELAAARNYLQQAIILKERLERDSIAVAVTLGNLGLVAADQGELQMAQSYQQQALGIEERLAPRSLKVVSSLGNLGNLAETEGDLAAAQVYLQRALEIEQMLAPDSLDVATSLDNLGNVARDQGNLAAARSRLQQSLALKERLAPDSLDVAASLNDLGMVAQRRPDWPEARRLAQRALELVRQQAGVVTGDEARQAFGASTALYAANLIRAQLALKQIAPAFTTLEEGRAQAMLQLLAERHQDVSAAPAPLRAAYQRALAARRRAEHALSQASGAEVLARRTLVSARQQPVAPAQLNGLQLALTTQTRQLAAAQAAYTQARVEADQRWAQIQKSAPRAFAAPLSLAQAARALPPGMLFIAFSVDQTRADLFLLRAGRRGQPAVAAYPLLLPLPELQARVNALIEQITDPLADPAATTAASRALFAALFPAPARSALRRARRLLISPDGPLWRVPFAVLVTNTVGTPRYLGAEKPLTFTQSLTLFAQSRRDRPRLAPERQPVALIVGDPVFSRLPTLIASVPGSGRERAAPPAASPTAHASAGGTLPVRSGERGALLRGGPPPAPLPGTRPEALGVARLYGAAPLLGEQASEAAVRQRISQADVIHPATHGYLDPVRAMSSGLLLTVPIREPGIDDTNNDGVLQAWEIYSQLHLKAELVVLSACETGRGQNVEGEGIVGLTRALQYAGARSVVASQWAVADASTATLMVAFHQGLRTGLAKDEALRRAMARVRSDPQTASPYYWAPFFLIGDPDNPDLGPRRAGPARPSRRTKESAGMR